VKTNNLGHFVIIQNECSQEGCSIHGDVLSTATGEWSSFMISPEGQDCVGFKLKFNKKGQGLIVWSVENDEEYIQAAELNVD